MKVKNEKKLNNHTRLFNTVQAVPKKKMSHAEKAMFSYIISYVIQDDIFKLDNKYIANALGDTIQSLTDYITRLEDMGLIHAEYSRGEHSNGNYFVTKRIITVNDLEGWTVEGVKRPEVPLIPKKNSKKKYQLPKTIDRVKVENEKMDIVTSISDNPIPIVMVQVDLKQAESIAETTIQFKEKMAVMAQDEEIVAKKPIESEEIFTPEQMAGLSNFKPKSDGYWNNQEKLMYGKDYLMENAEALKAKAKSKFDFSNLVKRLLENDWFGFLKELKGIDRYYREQFHEPKTEYYIEQKQAG